MKKIAGFIIRYRHIFTGIFAALVIVCAFLIPKVETNYDMTKYLEADAQSVVALEKMEEEFESTNTAQILIKGISAAEGEELAAKLRGVTGVSSVVFDGDSDTCYRDGNALLKIFLNTGAGGTDVSAAIDAVRDALSGYEVALSGSAVQSQYLRAGVAADMVIILVVSLAIVLGILFLTSNSWADVLLFAIIVAGSIVINMGTNIFLGSISFITNSICAVMQLALSMDYSIILLHRFDEELQKGLSKKDAIAEALAKTFAPVSASSLTTVAGLVALMFMRFTIGFDIGLVLAKGVVISLLCVFLFMPAFTLLFAKLIEKTKHKSLYAKLKEKGQQRQLRRTEKAQALCFAAAGAGAESAETESGSCADAAAGTGAKASRRRGRKIRTFADFQNASKWAVSIGLVVVIAAACVLQSFLSYSYVIDTSKYKSAPVNVEKKEIEEAFGVQNPLIVLIPAGDVALEEKTVNVLSAYTFEGEKVINTVQSALTSGLYTEVSETGIEQVDSMLALIRSDMIEAEYLTEEEPMLLLNALSFLSKEKFLQRNKDSLQSWADENAESFSEEVLAYAQALEGSVTAAEFAVLYFEDGMTTAQAERLWADMGLSAQETQELSKALEAAAGSALFDENPSLAKKLGMQTGFATILLMPFERDALVAQGLPRSIVDALFAQAGKGSEASITGAEFLSAGLIVIKENNILSLYGFLVQSQTDALYKQTQMFVSENYSRIVCNLDLPVSSDEAFAAVEDILKTVKEQTGLEDMYLVCESYNYLDIKKSFDQDTVTVNLISFFAIFFIILLTFRSVSVPILLTMLIQGAIWVNVAISVLMQSPIFFISYLMVLCIQMGATVDYAILLTDRYIAARHTQGKKESMAAAMDASIITILTSGSILVIAAFVVGIISRVAIISTIGYLLARGCLISVLFVLFALPQVLLLCDPILRKTTLGGGKMLPGPKKEKKKKTGAEEHL